MSSFLRRNGLNLFKKSDRRSGKLACLHKEPGARGGNIFHEGRKTFMPLEGGILHPGRKYRRLESSSIFMTSQHGEETGNRKGIE
jgi:hypothetical protein